jgi:hypothetical protein
LPKLCRRREVKLTRFILFFFNHRIVGEMFFLKLVTTHDALYLTLIYESYISTPLSLLEQMREESTVHGELAWQASSGVQHVRECHNDILGLKHFPLNELYIK